MFQLLHLLVEMIQPILVPVCFCGAWLFIGTLGWTLIKASGDTIDHARQMHRIPCSECRFFTNDYHLKCTIRPHQANTEAAIDCSDYRSRS